MAFCEYNTGGCFARKNRCQQFFTTIRALVSDETALAREALGVDNDDREDDDNRSTAEKL